ncbi:MAG: DUF4827 domain-containing protein [Bacteroidaceae bacterium]|jgi:hypothetical protein|nr:DUF4827 domain-containing protein [Bacteroidaceae bacterium]
MKKILFSVLAACVVSTSILTTTSCNEDETYAEQKDKEKKAIGQFLEDNDFVGKITPISEEQFYAQDSTTDLSKNEFVRFNDDGIYMQIVRKGNGPTMVELAKDRKDSTVTRPLICKFLEYDIEGADTTYSNIYMSSINDKMLCTYSHYGRSYTASFTEGVMQSAYGSTVPKGWLKPLDYIRLTKVAGEEAKVRLIVPHSSGTNNASGYVLPFYYEITYQIPPNY